MDDDKEQARLRRAEHSREALSRERAQTRICYMAWQLYLTLPPSFAGQEEVNRMQSCITRARLMVSLTHRQ